MEKTEIIAEDTNRYLYTTSLINVKNPLGIVKATITEYAIYLVTDIKTEIGKLYKTKENTWYDMPGVTPIHPLLKNMLRIAIEKSEKINVFTNKETSLIISS